jgi:tetratricopeptide (TPR) repeat protein
VPMTREITDVAEGELRIEGNVLRYVSVEGSFSIPLADIALAGEYTTPFGPAACDYFLVVLTNHGAQYEIPFYAGGRDEVLSTLRDYWQAPISLELSSSTSFASKIVWPLNYAGQQLFEFRQQHATGFLSRVRARLGFTPVVSTLAPSALEALLDVAHRELDDDPGRALATTAFVLEQLEGPVPPASLCGRAWKEHGTALYMAGRYEEALQASERAGTILANDPALAADRGTALLLTALVKNALLQREAALALLDECAAIFAAHHQIDRSLKALELRGIVLFDLGRDQEALATFHQALAQAEALGNERELARIENNIGRCALKAGNFAEAMRYVQRAAFRFKELGMDAECTRAFWCRAKIDQAQGRTDEALAELGRVIQEFKKLGMYSMAEKVMIERDELARAA